MLLLLLAALSVPLAADEVDNRVADRCHEILESSVVAFYLPHCIDTEHGGYLEVLDADGKFVGGERFTLNGFLKVCPYMLFLLWLS